MGTIAARKAYKLISNAKHILTLEILSDMQAMYFKNPDNLGMAIGKIYDILSKEFVVYNNERVFHDDLVQFRKLLFSSQLFDDLSLYWR